MENLITKVKLPSNGVFNPAYKGDITLDMMGFEEEKIAYGATDDEAIDIVINRCVKSPENFDASSLLPQDRRFILMKLRIHTYGDEYHVIVRENGENVEEKISLDDIEVKELPEDFKIPSGTLPISGDKIQIRPLTVADLRKIDDYARDKAEKMNLSFSDVRYEAVSAKRIGTINGESRTSVEVLNWLRSLKGKDLAYIRYLVDKIDFGYASTVHIKCKDGVERDVFVRMTGEFFRPRFDD